MAVRIITGTEGEQVLYCSTTMQAFGPVHEDKDIDLEDFLKWLPLDARKYDQDQLDGKYYEWIISEKKEAYYDWAKDKED